MALLRLETHAYLKIPDLIEDYLRPISNLDSGELACAGGTREVHIKADLFCEGQEGLNSHAVNVGALGHGHVLCLEYL